MPWITDAGIRGEVLLGPVSPAIARRRTLYCPILRRNVAPAKPKKPAGQPPLGTGERPLAGSAGIKGIGIGPELGYLGTGT